MNAITAVKATVIKRSHDYRTDKRVPDETLEIVADSEDELLALFFREYKNRYKYCNTVSYALADPEWNAKYIAWISNIANYAKHGGDMW